MIAIIKTTVSNKKEALRLGKLLLGNKLIVCSDIKKMTSQYFWNGKYHEETEYDVTFKTSLSKNKQAIKFLKNNHPYEIPLIASTIFEVNNSYKGWMDQILD